MIYKILIYRGKKIIHVESLQSSASSDNLLISSSPKSCQDDNENVRLTIGMLAGIAGMVAMLSPSDVSNRFESYVTPEYRLDYFETVTGYIFVVLSDPREQVVNSEVRADFERLYNLLFVPLVIRNPLFDPKRFSGDLRDSNCDVFLSELRNHFHSLLKSESGTASVAHRQPSIYSPSLI